MNLNKGHYLLGISLLKALNNVKITMDSV